MSSLPLFKATSHHDLVADCIELFAGLSELPLEERIETINSIREALHEHSPFAEEPVDFVRWVPANDVFANDYNPRADRDWETTQCNQLQDHGG